MPHPVDFLLSTGWDSTTPNSPWKVARSGTKAGAPSMARSCFCAVGGKAQLLPRQKASPHQHESVCPIHGAFLFLRHGWESTTLSSSESIPRSASKTGGEPHPCASPFSIQPQKRMPRSLVGRGGRTGESTTLNSQIVKARSASTPPQVHPSAEAAPAGM